MKILGLDSSGLVAGVAVVEKDNLLAEYTVNYKKTHSQTLLPMLDAIAKMIDLDLDSIDAIAVAGGPGSFTGLRIGSATAKGLGLALQKPLIQIPTVDGLAYNLWGCRDMVCPLMDARRNQTYTGLYEFTADRMETLKSQCAVGIDEIVFGRRRAGISAVSGRKLPGAIFLCPGPSEQTARSFRGNFGLQVLPGRKDAACSGPQPGLSAFIPGRTGASGKRAAGGKMTELEFGELEVGDIPAVAELEQQLFSCPWSEQAFLETFHQDTLFVTARTGHEIAGYCGMYCYAGGEGEITNVAVAPRCQNQGIGRRMLTYLLKQARSRGMVQIILEVRVSNENAIHLYEKLGFKNTGIRKNLYELPREDGMIMVLE